MNFRAGYLFAVINGRSGASKNRLLAAFERQNWHRFYVPNVYRKEYYSPQQREEAVERIRPFIKRSDADDVAIHWITFAQSCKEFLFHGLAESATDNV